MTYRLLALDVDGTLFHGEPLLSPRLRLAIGRAVQAGVRVTLASGRMFRSAGPIARELGLNAPLVCYNGAMIRALHGEQLYHQPVPLALAHEVVALARERSLHLNAYVDDALCVERVTAEARFSSNLARVELRVVEDMRAFLQAEPTKLVIITEAQRAGPLQTELSQRFTERLSVARSLPTYVEIVHPRVSKWRALERLCAHLDVAPGEVIAVGDSYNDAEMIARAGLGVAMATAPAEIQALAGYVAPAATEDGVAHVIEQFL
ncbi:MAG: HAD family phosphatase [Chloroflexi bacterium]|nr:HAD family phosphatase [Chloroflexota bacterium]